MLLHALLLPLCLGPLQAQEPPHGDASDHSHGDDFTSMLEHRAFPELMKWKERHPWRAGTEVRKFVLRFEAERAKGDPEVDRAWEMHAAFLAEALADDVYSAWLITVLRFDVETRARFDTVRAGLADIAASIPVRQAASILSIIEEIDGLRPPVAPSWAFETCAGDLTRIAEAAWDAGAIEVARLHAEEILSIADRTHDGETAVACAGLLGIDAYEAGDLRGAIERFGKAVEVAESLEEFPERFEFTLKLAAVSAEHMREHALLARVERLRARIATRRGEAKSAFDQWKRSVEAIESLRRRRGTVDSWKPLLDSGPDPYLELALAAARNGDADEAWKAAQRLRARRLFENQLTGDGSVSEGPAAAQVAAARRELEQRESALRRAPSEQIAEHLESVEKAEGALDSALLEVEARDPRAAVLLGFARSILDPARIQKDLAAGGLDAIVEYVVGETETVALTMNPKARGALVLPIGAAKVDLLLGQILAPMERLRRGEIEPARLEFDVASARELHAALVGPVASSLGARIAIVPDGPLERLPFEMLVSGGEAGSPDPGRPLEHLASLRFLLEDRAVTYLRSATGLASGSEAVVSTRWTVDDGTMAVWTKSFQASVASKQPVIDALRSAQLEILRSRDPRGFPRAHPWFWAGWVARRGS